jgi:tripartite-type tricarboxylate transporter receptor subunit TctC
MKFGRRRFLCLAGAAAVPVATRIGWAQSYPTRTVRIVVGFPAGGTTDIVVRLIGHWLSERLGQPFVVENRPGANTNIATDAVVRAPADGYTLLAVGSTSTINAALQSKANFNLSRDLAMIAGINNSPLVLEINSAIAVRTVPEFISYVKANSGRVSLASFGSGSISHVAGELFKIVAGIEMLHVPYRGSAPMVIDLMGGQVMAAFDNLPASIELIRTGKLRALAVTTAVQSEVLPQVPSLGEFFPGYEASAFVGLAAPKGTPAEVLTKLNKEINAGLVEHQIKARLAEMGSSPFVLSPAEFNDFIVREIGKWSQVVRQANIKIE